MIHIRELWLCTTPVDMRSGTERLLAHVITTLGAECAHHGYLFSNARAIRLLFHDDFGVWCAARRLNAGGFVWANKAGNVPAALQLTRQQFDAWVFGPPWQRLPEMDVITRV